MCWKRGAPGRRGSGSPFLACTNRFCPGPILIRGVSRVSVSLVSGYWYVWRYNIQEGHPRGAQTLKVWKFSASACFPGWVLCYFLFCVVFFFKWWTCPLWGSVDCWDLEMKWRTLNFVIYIVFGRRLIQRCQEYLEASSDPERSCIFTHILLWGAEHTLGLCYWTALTNHFYWQFKVLEFYLGFNVFLCQPTSA